MRFTVVGARRFLGLHELCTAEEVQTAYRAAVKANHPDTAAAVTGQLIAVLQEARDVLLEALKSPGGTPPCAQCAGVGKIRGRFGLQTCEGCSGTGDRNA